MIKVEFLGPINKEPIEIEAASLSELSTKLKRDESLKNWLPKCAVAVNDVMTKELNTVLNDGDRVSILPPVCGG